MNRVISWVKENKVAAAAVAGLAFLFMAKKGSGGDGGGGDGGEALEDDGSGGAYAVGVPIAGGDYDYDDGAEIDRDDYKEGIEAGLELADKAREEDIEDEETATDEPPPSDSTPTPLPDKQGITIKGKFFRHATGYTISRVDNQGWTEYLIKYDGRNERWQEKRGQWLKGWENPTRDPKRDEPKDEPKRSQEKGNEVRASKPKTVAKKKTTAKAKTQTTKKKDDGPKAGTKLQGKSNAIKKTKVKTPVKAMR